MSIEAFGRALRAPLSGNGKVILLGLANHAHPDGTCAFPGMETLALYAHCDRRSAQRNVRKLETDGFIERDGIGPRGQSSWRICFERWEGGRQNATPSETPPAVPAPPGGAVPAPPEPSIEPSKGEQRARGGRDTTQPPPDFPDELRPHARQVMRILRDVAERHSAREVTAYALGAVIMANPRKPLVRAAHELAAWSATSRQIRNVVSTYSNWLGREGNLASVEPLPGEEPQGLPDGVTPLHGRSLRDQREIERRERGERDMESIRRLQERQR